MVKDGRANNRVKKNGNYSTKRPDEQRRGKGKSGSRTNGAG